MNANRCPSLTLRVSSLFNLLVKHGAINERTQWPPCYPVSSVVNPVSTVVSNLKKRRGLTLVEVVAALVLLATLLVGMLSSYQIHRQQIVRATEGRQAVDVAEQLLADWFTATPSVPRNARGTVMVNRKRWIWTTATVSRRQLTKETYTEIVRLRVYSSKMKGRPAVEVDVMVPKAAVEPRLGALP